MQVAVGSFQCDLRIGHAAQHRADRGRIDVPHASVADQREVTGEFVFVGNQEVFQVWAAYFLLAFDQHGDARGDFAGGFLPGAHCLDEHHRLTLVVHRPARDETLAERAIDELWLERRALPEFQRIDRLHVVVAVEQHVRALITGGTGQVRDHDRMPGGGSHLGAETKVGKLVANPLRGVHAVLLVVRLGTDGGNAQQIEQPSARGFERCVDMPQHGGDGVGRRSGHG